MDSHGEMQLRNHIDITVLGRGGKQQDLPGGNLLVLFSNTLPQI